MNENRLPISVIIVNYKTPELTLNALKALFLSSKLPSQVILVDNGSKDKTVELVKTEFPQVVIIESEKNLGFAGGNNIGIKRASQPYVWLLNSDTETGYKTMEQVYDYLVEHQDCGAVGPQLIYPTKELQSVGGFFPNILNIFYYLLPWPILLPNFLRKKLHSIALLPQMINNNGLQLDYVTGAAIMVRREVIDQIGLMPEDYFMYFEETDWCLQMKRYNWKVMVVRTDPVIHVYGGSFKSKRDAQRLYVFLSSLRKFVRRNYTGLKKIIILAEVFLFGRLSIIIKTLR